MSNEPEDKAHKSKLRLIPNVEVPAELTFVNACHHDGEDLHVDFSDGTTAHFKAEELAALRPTRAPWELGE